MKQPRNLKTLNFILVSNHENLGNLPCLVNSLADFLDLY